VVDDDVRICKLLNRYLAREGYKVSTAASGEQMRRVFDHDVPDLVILDLILPDEDGFTLARELRTWSDVGIIMLTGKTEQVDKIVGLEIGADDYLTKPFDERELLARVRSVLRRAPQTSRPRPEDDRSVAHFAGFTLNLAAHELISPIGDQVHLTNYEFQLLSALVLNANQVLDRDQILDLIAGRDWAPTDRSIDVLIGKLRKKLNEDSQKPILIKTIRGTGYRFIAHVRFKI
jgi:DNA-binding response OmpR family regulator